ncbi:hypothetical protein VSDG_03262 [Cytospora chrysosperma]|uniref:Pentatricopeptide repeat domain-containing protein n=1 Tax=Cytospora chrysosperma TaxID=252740 RepID=A0A423WBF0_CYTCH|nr:hypothetical protein VSDG_03262 [Valsa sordida]
MPLTCNRSGLELPKLTSTNAELAPTSPVRSQEAPPMLASLTATYTTASGTAVIPDALYGDGRSKELGQRIEGPLKSLTPLQAPSSLPVVRQDGSLCDASTVKPPMGLMRLTASADAIQTLLSICKMDDALIRHAESTTVLDTFLQYIHKTYDPRHSLDRSQFQIAGVDFTSAEEALQEEGEEGGLVHREPLTQMQFQRYHEMINKLVDSLIIQAYHDANPGSAEAAQRALQSLDSAWTAMRLLRSEGYPRYNHPDLDPAATIKARDDLRDMLQQVFALWDDKTDRTPVKFHVAKICYNLLVCPVPPSIHHYNVLILGFTRRNRHNLANVVVQSLLNDSRLRPTPQTIVCLLLHHQHQGDLLGFYGVIRRMLAIDTRGMLIRRRWHEDVLRIPDLRRWARQPEVTTSLKGNWVIERPPRNRAIYDTLVSGLLYFGRVKDAAKVFVASLQERRGISVRTFVQLLRQCLYTLHAPAADILLRGFIDNADVMSAFILRSDCPRRLAEHLYPLLNMGKPPSWPFSEERASMTWYSKTMVSSPEDGVRIRRLTVAMFIRQTETQLRRLEYVLSRLERLYEATTIDERVLFAACGVKELKKLRSHHRYLAARLLKHQVLLTIARHLEHKSWDIRPGHLGFTHRKLVRLLEKRIRRPAQPGGWGAQEHDEEVMVLAEQWIRYRLGRMHGLMNEVRRTTLYAELALLTGARLQEDAHRVLFAFPTDDLVVDKLGAWARWPVRGPDDDDDDAGEEAMEDEELDAEMGLAEDDGEGWPAPPDAWAASPAVRVV